jgi:hypothetical protein
MKQIFDATTLTAEQRKYLLMTFSSLDLLIKAVNELHPEWMPVLKRVTGEYLDEILALPEEEQTEEL